MDIFNFIEVSNGNVDFLNIVDFDTRVFIITPAKDSIILYLSDNQ